MLLERGRARRALVSCSAQRAGALELQRSEGREGSARCSEHHHGRLHRLAVHAQDLERRHLGVGVLQAVQSDRGGRQAGAHVSGGAGNTVACGRELPRRGGRHVSLASTGKQGSRHAWRALGMRGAWGAPHWAGAQRRWTRRGWSCPGSRATARAPGSGRPPPAEEQGGGDQVKGGGRSEWVLAHSGESPGESPRPAQQHPTW